MTQRDPSRDEILARVLGPEAAAVKPLDWAHPTQTNDARADLAAACERAESASRGAEPVPCGRIASATHCCEYHAIHSDDDFATALALLEQLRDWAGPHGLTRAFMRKVGDFLANQPAAPARTEALGKLTRPGATPWDERERTRLEAEQAVLDAVRAWYDEHFRDGNSTKDWWNESTLKLHSAELALRKLKP